MTNNSYYMQLDKENHCLPEGSGAVLASKEWLGPVLSIIARRGHDLRVWLLAGKVAVYYGKNKQVGGKLINLKGYSGTMYTAGRTYKDASIYLGQRNGEIELNKNTELIGKRIYYEPVVSVYTPIPEDAPDPDKYKHMYVLTKLDNNPFGKASRPGDPTVKTLGVYNDLRDAQKDMQHKIAIDSCAYDTVKGFGLTNQFVKHSTNKGWTETTFIDDYGDIIEKLKIEDIETINQRQF